MKVTVESLAAGEHLPLRVGDCVVFLDGVAVFDVIEGDDEVGYVQRYCRDYRGNLVIDYDNGRLVTEILYGDVVFLTEDQCEQEKGV